MTRVTRRRRRRHYKRGVHVSLKTGKECRYRSGWELSYLKYLDSNQDIVTFQYEELVIPYVSNVRTGKLRKYYPDFFVEYSDGHKELVEIKPSKRMTQMKVQKKLLAAGDWCRANDVSLVIVTEKELKLLGLLK